MSEGANSLAADIRYRIYQSFALTGAPPDFSVMAHELGETTTVIREQVDHLAQERHVVLDSDGNIAMAHPFATIPLGFSVMGRSTLWWGGCAWDSFAIPHVVEDSSVLVATTCPNCDRALAWQVDREAPPRGEEVAHFLVPVSRMWDDVVHTCSNQRIFCSEQCVDAWLTTNGRERGSVLSMEMLWNLASGWYEGRLELHYQRREPAAAADYFRSAGLSGEFWGLGPATG